MGPVAILKTWVISHDCQFFQIQALYIFVALKFKAILTQKLAYKQFLFNYESVLCQYSTRLTSLKSVFSDGEPTSVILEIYVVK